MARTAIDVRLMFSVLAGHDIEDPFSAPVPLRIPQVSGIKVGVWREMFDVPFQPELLEAVDAAANTLREIGIPAEEFVPSGLQRAPKLWFFFFGQLSAPFTSAMVQGREADAHWTSMELTERALAMRAPTAQDLVLNLSARDAMRTHLFRQMEDYPVLLTPVCGGTAFPHRTRPFDLLKMMEPVTVFNLLGMPAVVIPFGISRDGLPIGIQLVARAHEEELLLEIATRLEEVRGVFQGPPDRVEN